MRKHLMKRRPALMITGVIGLALLVYVVAGTSRRAARGGAEKEEEAPAEAAVKVHTVPVTRGSLTQTLRVMGTLQALPNQSARVWRNSAGALWNCA
jgi:multidrug efflux pump subunit AcrA (membrane-fusion protein)